MGESRLVRDATVGDAATCAGIHAPYVRDTVVSFELEPPTPDEMAARIGAAIARHAGVVLEDGGRVVGCAYGATSNPRAAHAPRTLRADRGQGRAAGRY